MAGEVGSHQTQAGPSKPLGCIVQSVLAGRYQKDYPTSLCALARTLWPLKWFFLDIVMLPPYTLVIRREHLIPYQQQRTHHGLHGVPTKKCTHYWFWDLKNCYEAYRKHKWARRPIRSFTSRRPRYSLTVNTWTALGWALTDNSHLEHFRTLVSLSTIPMSPDTAIAPNKPNTLTTRVQFDKILRYPNSLSVLHLPHLNFPEKQESSYLKPCWSKARALFVPLSFVFST